MGISSGSTIRCVPIASLEGRAVISESISEKF